MKGRINSLVKLICTAFIVLLVFFRGENVLANHGYIATDQVKSNQNVQDFLYENKYLNKKVLFISSYSEDFLSLPDQTNGLRSVFDAVGIHMNIEFMDTKRFDTNENINLFYNHLKYKLENLEPYDGIIVGDDSALIFAMEYENELFDGLPIIFLGINDLKRAETASQIPNMTGIVEETSIEENIALGLTFNKEAKNIVAIVDSTITGIGNMEQFYSYVDSFKELTFTHINVSDYTFEEVGNVISQISDDSIILYFSMYTDKTGRNITIPEAINILTNHTSLPILRSEIGGIGLGVLGGKMISYYESGKIAANMLVDVFKGTAIESIEMVDISPNFYTFDYKLLKDHGINLKLLPKDSILVNKEESFYEANRDIVLKTLALITFLAFVLAILTIDNVKRRKMEKALQESNEELSQTFEELAASEEELRTQYDTIRDHSDKIDSLNQKYLIAIESTESAVWEYNINTKNIRISKDFILAINSSLKELENIYTFIDILLTEDSKNALLAEFENKVSGYEINIQLPIIDQYGRKRWVLIRGKGVKELDGSYNLIHGIMLETTKMKEQEEYIEHIANHDYLTNLPNRLNFISTLNEELKFKKKGAILLLDIDNFKKINDTLGHRYGDKLLVEIAKKLSVFINNEIKVFRFGGDEFLIIIKNTDCIDTIKGHVDEILKSFIKPVSLLGSDHFVNFSIGISLYPTDSREVDHLLMNADTAMYNAKKSGRNNYMFYHINMQDELHHKAKIEDILRHAMNEDGFKLVYQPQVNVNTGEIVSFEALLRLRYHNIAPSIYIPIAEDVGLINEIGRWVVKETIRQIARWSEKGFVKKPVSINFSTKQMNDTSYIEFLRNTLEYYNVEPKYLEIEITESILLEKSETTMSFLENIKNIGINIALDDFGTGYSSLNYLTYIPVDKIKLDKSLCEKFLGLDNVKVMNCLIGLVHSLNLVITAEGIEQIEQYHRLKEGGCDYIQGYLFSKPLSNDEIEQIYNSNMLERIYFI